MSGSVEDARAFLLDQSNAPTPFSAAEDAAIRAKRRIDYVALADRHGAERLRERLEYLAA